MLPPPWTLLAWDSPICLRCSVKRMPRYILSQRQSYSTLTPRPTWPRTRQAHASPPASLSARPFTALTFHKAQHHDLNDNQSPLDHNQTPWHIHDDSKNASPTRGPKPDVRSRLRLWQRGKDWQPSLLPSDIVDSGPVLNNLTRPEQVSTNELAGALQYEQEADDVDSDLEERGFLPSDLEQATIQMENLAASQSPRLARGDLVALATNKPVAGSYCVFLGYSDTGYLQYYSVDGKIEYQTSMAHMFHVKGFLPPEAVEPLLPHLPHAIGPFKGVRPASTECVPREVAAPVLASLVKFREQAEDALRQLSPALANAHALLAHPTDTVFMTLQDIADALCRHCSVDFDMTSAPALYALSHALLRQEVGFLHCCLITYGFDRLLIVLSRETVDSVYRVQKSVRAYQEEAALAAGGFQVSRSTATRAALLRTFINKSRRLIGYGRDLQRASPRGEPLLTLTKEKKSQLESAGQPMRSLEFSDSDRDFIRFIALAGVTHLLTFHPTIKLLAQLILRAMGLYAEAQVPLHAPRSFLMSIGVFNPYEHTRQAEFFLAPFSNSLESDLAKAQAQIEASGSEGGFGDLQDSMSHFRKDWGNMTVLCIDGARTVDIDDGISLEPVPGSSEQMWIHIHIAHISAFTSPDHLLGKAARHFQSNAYFPSGRVSMLPSWASEPFNIGPDKPVLTFSAKLDEACNILETKIQPGIVRNVVRITPERIDKEVFNLAPDHREIFSLKVGKELEESPRIYPGEASTLTDELKSTLQTLLRISAKLTADNVLAIDDLKAETFQIRATHMTENAFASSFDLAPSHAQFATEDPFVQLRTRERLDTSRQLPSRVIVEQAMLLAGRIAAEYAQARGIPLVFSGTQPTATGVELMSANLRKRMQFSEQPSIILNHCRSLFASAMNSSAPVYHAFLASTAWARVTSPIRRFTDLVCHWQIDASLREEHRMGTSLIGKDETSHLPFQQSDIDQTILFSNARLRNIKNYDRAERTHWALHAMGRAFYFGEAPLPELLQCRIRETSQVRSGRGSLVGFGAHCEFITEEGEDGNPIEPGDVWEVRIKEIHFSAQRVWVVPVRRTRAGSRRKTTAAT